MKSMTGYGYGELQDEAIHMMLELKSYNNRYLDMNINLPTYLNPLEPKVREYLSSRVRRGRVELFLRSRELEEDLEIFLDAKAAESYAQVLRDLAKVTGIDEEPRLGHLIRMEGIFKTERKHDLDRLWDQLQPLLDGVFTDYEASRTTEGEATRADILNHLTVIEDRAEIAAGFADQLEEKIHTGLKDRFAQVLGDSVDENRIMAETAVLLVKYSINEEIVRLKAHTKSFREIAESDSPVGKKLDFLCQEMNREINTIGSKSTIAEVNQAVVDAKDALENIREQLRNVE